MKFPCKCKRVQCCIHKNTKIETCLSQLEVAGMILFCCIHCVASNGWRSSTLNKGIPGKPLKREGKKGSVLYHSMLESPGHVGGREGEGVGGGRGREGGEVGGGRDGGREGEYILKRRREGGGGG